MTVTICLAIGMGLLAACWPVAVLLFGGPLGRHQQRREASR